ncbi:hypothetical protein T492DRAFT_1028031 [Pavlovales sp. CCMP2436]|nr:hypothetical protein T492DRAFT_1028031 [Pavlovales sp. CCMP2436]
MVLGVENYDAQRAAVRSAQKQEDEMRKLMRDCAQQLGRLQAQHAKERSEAEGLAETLRKQAKALKGELQAERAQAVQAARALKRQHADNLRAHVTRATADTLRREVEASILRHALDDEEACALAASEAQSRRLEEVCGVHSEQERKLHVERAAALKERSVRHTVRLEAVVASEQDAHSALAHQRTLCRQLEGKLHALGEQLRHAGAQCEAGRVHISLLATELDRLEMWSAATAADLGESSARAVHLELKLHCLTASNAEEVASQQDRHDRQLETVEERVRQLIAKKNAELSNAGSRLARAQHELDVAKIDRESVLRLVDSL